MATKKQFHESTKSFIQRMMKTLAGTYSNFRPNENPDQARAYMEALERMIGEFGQGRTAAAIAKACDLIPDFVPTPARIREFMPAPEGILKTCTLCHPSGYVMVYTGYTVAANPVNKNFGAARRCDHQGGRSPVVNDYDGNGYGGNDIKLLAKLHARKRLETGRPLTTAEQDGLLQELDRRTGRL